MNAPISSYLAQSELIYFASSDAIVFCRPIPDFLNGDELRYPKTGGRVFDLPNKIQGKKIPEEKFQSLERLSCIFCCAL